MAKFYNCVSEREGVNERETKTGAPQAVLTLVLFLNYLLKIL